MSSKEWISNRNKRDANMSGEKKKIFLMLSVYFWSINL